MYGEKDTSPRKEHIITAKQTHRSETNSTSRWNELPYHGEAKTSERQSEHFIG